MATKRKLTGSELKRFILASPALPNRPLCFGQRRVSLAVTDEGYEKPTSGLLHSALYGLWRTGFLERNLQAGYASWYCFSSPERTSTRPGFRPGERYERKLEEAKGDYATQGHHRREDAEETREGVAVRELNALGDGSWLTWEDSSNSSATIHVYVGRRMNEILTEVAREEGVSLSEFVRTLAIDRAKYHLHCKGVQEMRSMLGGGVWNTPEQVYPPA